MVEAQTQMSAVLTKMQVNTDEEKPIVLRMDNLGGVSGCALRYALFYEDKSKLMQIRCGVLAGSQTTGYLAAGGGTQDMDGSG